MINSAPHRQADDSGRIRIAWTIGISVVLAGVLVIAVVYGTHAFTILGRIGVKLT